MGCTEIKDKKPKNPHNLQNSQNSQNLQNSQNPQNPQNSKNPQIISTNPHIEERKESGNQRNETDVPITQSYLENQLNQPQINKEIISGDNFGGQRLYDNQDNKEDILKNPNQNIKKYFKDGSIIDDNIKKNDEEYIPTSIGKLCFDPLSLFVYNSKDNSFHVQKYELSLNGLEELNNTSSCCNGDNKLFVSGGNTNTGEIVDKLWIFDLDNYNVEEPFQIEGKINHSMIYIINNSKKYVFFVGGNTENVFYFDIEFKSINSWARLNKNRIEPALIKINNYLYVFDNFNKNEDINNFDLTFERTSFLVSSMPHWELIKPELSQQILDTKFIPKFFGIAKESNDNIIFLGGNIVDDNDNIGQNKNYKYDIVNNLMDLSDVPFVNIVLKEKKFFNFNNKKDVFFILPDFYKKCPQVVFYVKNKNLLKVVDYKPKLRNERRKNNDMENPDINNLNFGLKNYDFNMPKNLEKIENEIVEI